MAQKTGGSHKIAFYQMNNNNNNKNASNNKNDSNHKKSEKKLNFAPDTSFDASKSSQHNHSNDHDSHAIASPPSKSAFNTVSNNSIYIPRPNIARSGPSPSVSSSFINNNNNNKNISNNINNNNSGHNNDHHDDFVNNSNVNLPRSKSVYVPKPFGFELPHHAPPHIPSHHNSNNITPVSPTSISSSHSSLHSSSSSSNVTSPNSTNSSSSSNPVVSPRVSVVVSDSLNQVYKTQQQIGSSAPWLNEAPDFKIELPIQAKTVIDKMKQIETEFNAASDDEIIHGKGESLNEAIHNIREELATVREKYPTV
jgi:hypothetical protein